MSESLHPALAPPRNESPLHYALKQVALWWLRRTGCWIVADEVAGLGGALNDRTVADAAGISYRDDGHRLRWTLRVVEVKVSRSDYQAGFCQGGHLRYILTPPGLLTVRDLKPGFGLIEADLRRVRWTLSGSLDGIEVVRRATRHEAEWDDALALPVLMDMGHRLTGYRLSHNLEFGPYAKRLALGEEATR